MTWRMTGRAWWHQLVIWVRSSASSRLLSGSCFPQKLPTFAHSRLLQMWVLPARRFQMLTKGSIFQMHVKDSLSHMIVVGVNKAVHYLRWLDANFSLWRPSSIPGQSIWDLWWTQWHWAGSLLSTLVIIIRGWHMRPICSNSTKGHAVTPFTNK